MDHTALATGIAHLDGDRGVSGAGDDLRRGFHVIGSSRHREVAPVMLAQWNEEHGGFESHTMFAFPEADRWRHTGASSGGTGPDLSRFDRDGFSRGAVLEDGRHLDRVPVGGAPRELCCSEFWCSKEVTGFSATSSLGRAEGDVSTWGLALVICPVGEPVSVRFTDRRGRVLHTVSVQDDGILDG